MLPGCLAAGGSGVLGYRWVFQNNLWAAYKPGPVPLVLSEGI